MFPFNFNLLIYVLPILLSLLVSKISDVDEVSRPPILPLFPDFDQKIITIDEAVRILVDMESADDAADMMRPYHSENVSHTDSYSGIHLDKTWAEDVHMGRSRENVVQATDIIITDSGKNKINTYQPSPTLLDMVSAHDVDLALVESSGRIFSHHTTDSHDRSTSPATSSFQSPPPNIPYHSASNTSPCLTEVRPSASTTSPSQSTSSQVPARSFNKFMAGICKVERDGVLACAQVASLSTSPSESPSPSHSP